MAHLKADEGSLELGNYLEASEELDPFKGV